MHKCQVRIIEEGRDPNNMFTLYRHMDGYPTEIIKDLKKAYSKYGKENNANRADSVVSFICSVNPTEFTPQKDDRIKMVSNIYNLYISDRKDSKYHSWGLEIFSLDAHKALKEISIANDFKLIFPRMELKNIDLEALCH